MLATYYFSAQVLACTSISKKILCTNPTQLHKRVCILQCQSCTVGESEQLGESLWNPQEFGVWERNNSCRGTIFSWPLRSVKTRGFPSVNHFALSVVTPLGLQQRRSQHSHSPPLSWWHMVLLCSPPSPHPEYVNNCFIVFHQSTRRTCLLLFFHPLCLTAIHISFLIWPYLWYFGNHFYAAGYVTVRLILALRCRQNAEILMRKTSEFCTGSLWVLCD